MFSFPRETQRASIAVAFFPKSSEYFPASQPAMLNFQVDDLDTVLDRLAVAGVNVNPKRESCDYGRFGGSPTRKAIASSYGNRHSSGAKQKLISLN